MKNKNKIETVSNCDKNQKNKNQHLLNADFGYSIVSIYTIAIFAFTVLLG